MHCHATDDDYWMELADEESNPRNSVPKKTKKKLKAIDRRSLSCLVLSERRLDDRAGGRIVWSFKVFYEHFYNYVPMILPILSCMSAVKILRLSWCTSKFIHLLVVVGGAFYLNLIFYKIRY